MHTFGEGSSRYAVHKTRAIISDDHRLIVELPSDFPPGDAEVIVLTAAAVAQPAKRASLNVLLDNILVRIPETPVPSAEALRRENMYEDD